MINKTEPITVSTLTMLGVVAILLLACSGASAHESDLGTAHGKHRGATSGDAASGDRYVVAKPLSVIHFVKPARYTAKPGDTFEVSFTMMVSQDVSNIDVAVMAKSGVTLGVQSKTTGALVAGAETTVTFSVTALTEGRHYVNVMASAETGTGSKKSVYSLPIEVGLAAKSTRSQTAAKLVVDEQGNTLVLMPAVEPQKHKTAR